MPARVTMRFPVSGLDCTTCGGNVRAAMRVVPGVLAVSPNVVSQEVAVTFDPGRTNPTGIRARLDSIGLCGR
jgi:hypothetical protein